MSTLARYRHYLGVLFDRGERWRLTMAAISSVVIALMDTVSVLIIAPLIVSMGDAWRSGAAGSIADHLGIDNQNTLVLLLLGWTVGGFVLKDLLTISYTWWSATFTSRIRAEAQVMMVDYYLRLPYHLHSHLGLAVILRKTNTCVTQAYSTFAAGILGLTSQTFTVTCISAALIVAAPTTSLTLIAVVGLVSLLFLRISRPINERIGRESLATAEESYNATFDAFGGIKETQLRHAQTYFLKAIANPTMRAAHLSRNATFLNALPKQLIEILFMLGLALAFGISTVVGDSRNILASLAMMVAGAFRLLPTIAAMMGSITSIKQGEPGTREFVMEKQDAIRRREGPAASGAKVFASLAFQDSLRLERVRFRYSESPIEVLRGINLTITAGETVAFVGSSGAGKSTLLDVIMGLQTPTSGEMTVDGVDVSTNLEGWQRNIGVVPQEVFLTDRTIAENVAFDQAKEDINEDLVRDSLRKADILDFVESQPRGIWSSFGERGRRLSGGQRQRIGIARALYRQPTVLILDEATSALDNETEARIAETIAALHGQITVIIVAHRLSTVRDADMIAYLEDGQVEATGTFSELQERSEGFRHLVDLASLEEKR